MELKDRGNRMNAKKFVQNGSIGKAFIIGAVYAAGAAVTKLTASYYAKAIREEKNQKLE